MAPGGNFALFSPFLFSPPLFACAPSRPAPFSPSPFFLLPSWVFRAAPSVTFFLFFFLVVCGLLLSPSLLSLLSLLSLSLLRRRCCCPCRFLFSLGWLLLRARCFCGVLGPLLPFLARFATSRLLSLRPMWVRSSYNVLCLRPSVVCACRRTAY